MKVRTWKKWRKVNRKLSAALAALGVLERRVESIMATQAELVEQVKAIGDKLTKIGGETSTLLTKVEELKALALNASPELQAAVEAVAAQAQVVDDLVPDAPTP